MSRRARLLFVTGFAFFGAATWAVEPYWSWVLRPPESPRGRVAREQRANDTAGDAAGRAVLGGAAGLIASLLAFTVLTRRR